MPETYEAVYQERERLKTEVERLKKQDDYLAGYRDGLNRRHEECAEFEDMKAELKVAKADAGLARSGMVRVSKSAKGEVDRLGRMVDEQQETIERQGTAIMLNGVDHAAEVERLKTELKFKQELAEAQLKRLRKDLRLAKILTVDRDNELVKTKTEVEKLKDHLLQFGVCLNCGDDIDKTHGCQCGKAVRE